MFSKISDFLRPLGLQKEPARNKDGGKGRKDDRERAPSAAPAADDDVTLISIEAIRRLLLEGLPAEDGAEKIALLSRLEQHGIKSVPVREGQSVWSALDDAGRFL